MGTGIAIVAVPQRDWHREFRKGQADWGVNPVFGWLF